MKKFVKIIALAVALLLAAAMSVACGVEYTDEEVIDAAKELIEASYGINEVYFGKGLPISDEDSDAAREFAEKNGFDLGNIQYLPVTEESPYKSIADIKEATAKVYSAEYCESLFKSTFEGFNDGTAAVFAKYMEDSQGVLTARIDLKENDLPDRTYDLETIKVTKKKKDKAVVEIVSYLDGEKEDKPLLLTLVPEEDGWRLDTPTY